MFKIQSLHYELKIRVRTDAHNRISCIFSCETFSHFTVRHRVNKMQKKKKPGYAIRFGNTKFLIGIRWNWNFYM